MVHRLVKTNLLRDHHNGCDSRNVVIG